MNTSQQRIDLNLEKLSQRISEMQDRIIMNAQMALEALEKGTLHRATGSTKMNETSSRSDAVFTVYLTQEIEAEGSWKLTNFPAQKLPR